MSTERGTFALVDTRTGLVVGGASYRLGDVPGFLRAVEFINEGREPYDEVRRFTNGETVRLTSPPPDVNLRVSGDCERCDGWHPGDDCGVTA